MRWEGSRKREEGRYLDGQEYITQNELRRGKQEARERKRIRGKR